MNPDGRNFYILLLLLLWLLLLFLLRLVRSLLLFLFGLVLLRHWLLVFVTLQLLLLVLLLFLLLLRLLMLLMVAETRAKTFDMCASVWVLKPASALNVNVWKRALEPTVILRADQKWKVIKLAKVHPHKEDDVRRERKRELRRDRKRLVKRRKRQVPTQLIAVLETDAGWSIDTPSGPLWVPCLAYADDVVAFAKSELALTRMLSQSCVEFGNIGLEVALDKKTF